MPTGIKNVFVNMESEHCNNLQEMNLKWYSDFKIVFITMVVCE